MAARKLRAADDPAASIGAVLVEGLGSGQVRVRLVGLAGHRQPVSVDVAPGLEERQELEPQALARLILDGIGREKVDVAEHDHAVPERDFRVRCV